MKKPSKTCVKIAVVLTLLVSACVWFFNNTTLALARLGPRGDSGYYATRAEMMSRNRMDAAYWFSGWRAVPVDATEIAFVGVTTGEGCGPWETRLTCRTTETAFLDMARVFQYSLATNSFVNALSEKDGGFPSDSPAFVEVLPELFPSTLPKEYLTFTCLTTNYTGMVMLLNRRSGKLYARLISKWRFGDKNDSRWLQATPKVARIIQMGSAFEHDPLLESTSLQRITPDVKIMARIPLPCTAAKLKRTIMHLAHDERWHDFRVTMDGDDLVVTYPADPHEITSGRKFK